MVTWSFLLFLSQLVPTSSIFGMQFDSKLTFEDYVLSIVSVSSQSIGILRLLKHLFVHTSVLLRCYFAIILPILEYCSPV